MPESGEQQAPPRLDETQRLLDWRLEQLARSGCPDILALELAAGDVDIHEFAELVAKGCPPATAARILA